jgi:DNA-binding MarR family transcriptional regulator
VVHVDEVVESTYIVAMIVTDTEAATRAALVRDIADDVARLSSHHRCAAARRVHHSGVSLGHLQILWILQEHGPMPVSRLADWLGIGAPNASGLLDRMEQRGLVDRSRDDDDRRVVLVRMTDAGRETIEEHDGWRAELVEQLVETLATDHLVALAGRLRQLASRAATPGAAPQPSAERQPTADLARGRGDAPDTGVPAR